MSLGDISNVCLLMGNINVLCDKSTIDIIKKCSSGIICRNIEFIWDYRSQLLLQDETLWYRLFIVTSMDKLELDILDYNGGVKL